MRMKLVNGRSGAGAKVYLQGKELEIDVLNKPLLQMVHGSFITMVLSYISPSSAIEL